MSNEPRNVSTEGLSPAVAEAIETVRAVLLAAGNNSDAFNAGFTLGELVASLRKIAA
jgi:hypothetical protein